MGVRFQLLGEVTADIDGRRLDLGHARQRCVLAVLLLEANHVVPMATLAERVWAEQLPASRYSALYSYLSRLRTALAPAPEARLARRGGGYALHVDPDAVDLFVFQRLVTRARAGVAEDVIADVAAVELFDQALRLWRGDAFAGVNAQWLHQVRESLQWQRLAAELDRNDIRLRRRDCEGLLEQLSVRSRQYPLDERLAAQLMHALCLAGRKAEALDHFQVMRKRLAEELGADPGHVLDRMHQGILRGEVTSSAATPARGAASPAAPSTTPCPPSGVPAQLPRDVPGFASRVAELARLDAVLAATQAAPAVRTALVVPAVTGTAGVGKTALAVYWAHRVSHLFPDGQLYVNLHGFDPDGPPVAAASAIAGFLEALGVTPQRTPVGLASQMELYHSLLAGRRMLVLLDNARDSEHVRPLLPGTPGCLALVTSRNQLTGLAAADGAHLMSLDLLSGAESHQMLTARLGQARVMADPAATDEIISRCAGLPLALAVVAARATARPRLPLAVLAEELRAAQGSSLDSFDSGDPKTDVRQVFSWSYRVLSAPAARLFRLLGLHPGPDITTPATASLAGLTVRETRPLLAELCRAHLLDEHLPGRYACHDLLRAYTTELAHIHEPEQERHAATHRILDHYLHTAYAADHLIRRRLDPITLPEPCATPESISDHHQAMAWFGAERSVLLAAVDRAAATGWDTHAWHLAWTLKTFLEYRGYWHDLVSVMRLAVDVACRLDDPSAEATAYRLLASAETLVREFDSAETHLRHVLDLCRRTSNLLGQAQAHANLADLRGRQGDPARALEHARESLRLFEMTDHRFGHGFALNNFGWYLTLNGDHRSALNYCQRALALHQEFGSRFEEASAWDSLGYAHHHLGDYDQSIDCYRQALRLFRDLGDRYAVALILTHLGEVHHAAGDAQAAVAAWQETLEILTELGHPDTDRVRELLAAVGSQRDL